jgi:hypothetical protein
MTGSQGDPKGEIKETTCYKFAGTTYETREEAELALAKADLREFLEQVLDREQIEMVLPWAIKNADKLMGLLDRARP